MSISEHEATFADREIRNYEPARGLYELGSSAFRIGLDYDGYSNGTTIVELIETLAKDPKAARLEALVVGPWDFEARHTSALLIAALVRLREKLPALRAIFLGDITYSEQEISWIMQSDVSPLLPAFPRLENLRVRGGSGLDLTLPDHPNLKTLAIESGGLPRRVFQRLAHAKLPALTHLELWTGSPTYEGDSTIDDVIPLLGPHRFPSLTRLALRNSMYTDDIARTLASFSSLDPIREVDLSLGTLTDAGAMALLTSPAIKRLRMLDLHRHYVSPSVAEQLRAALGGSVVLDMEGSEYTGDNSDEYYCAVSE